MQCDTVRCGHHRYSNVKHKVRYLVITAFYSRKGATSQRTKQFRGIVRCSLNLPDLHKLSKSRCQLMQIGDGGSSWRMNILRACHQWRPCPQCRGIGGSMTAGEQTCPNRHSSGRELCSVCAPIWDPGRYGSPPCANLELVPYRIVS